uniref:Uncharacterized protein n=1 Tax=Bostrychia moritziana TaxID=103713 RepID=A0A1Z1M6W3_BOSMO|nr:hypothetical protein [Bostrychia moritziana]ARW61756.1 hypothetical protein [Bostrychia moritziana]
MIKNKRQLFQGLKRIKKIYNKDQKFYHFINTVEIQDLSESSFSF